VSTPRRKRQIYGMSFWIMRAAAMKMVSRTAQRSLSAAKLRMLDASGA
jgi:hypothetical protein